MLEKILIVDDEKEIADLIEVYLQNENMDVYKFYSGEEALVCIGSTDFDWLYWISCFRISVDFRYVSPYEVRSTHIR